MKVLLYGINYSPELTGIGKYSGEMARWLAAHGHEVRVVTAPPYYPDWKVWQAYSPWGYSSCKEDGVTVIRCPLYVPAKPSAIKRMLHLGSFSLSSSLALLAQLVWKPDLVVLVVPTLFCSPQALLVAKLSGAQSALHIQDFEVDALFGLGIAKGGWLKRFAFAAERSILRAFDRVSTISSGMLNRARQKGVAAGQLVFFPNWSETERFRHVPRSPALLDRLGVDASKRVLLYAGNIGEKQGLEIVVEAAARLQLREELVFLVVGEGAGKARMQEHARQLDVRNMVFAPLQPYEDLPALLASVDCHLVIQKRGAADAVLPSKLTNILAVGGNAVITADADTSLGLLCEEYPGIAARVEPESVEALLDGIEACLAMPQPNRVATFYASEALDKDRILQRYVAEFDVAAVPVPASTVAEAASQAQTAVTAGSQRLIGVMQANQLALDLAIESAPSPVANSGVSGDAQALSDLIQRTAHGLKELGGGTNNVPVGSEVLSEIRLLIGRIVAAQQAVVPEERADAARAGAKVIDIRSFTDSAKPMLEEQPISGSGPIG